MRARPFPFATLPATSRAEIAEIARVRAAAASLRPEDLAEAIGDLCDTTATIALRRIRRAEEKRVASDAVGIALASTDDPSMRDAVLVEVEAALSRALVARALRQRAPRVDDAARVISPEVAGATAALVHAALRRAFAGGPLRVLAAGPAQVLARDLGASHHRVLTAALTITLGPDTFDARVHVPEDRLPSASARPMTAAALTALGDAPLALPIVAATCLAPRGEIAALRPGDAFVFPSTRLQIAGEVVRGSVALVAPSAERGLSADLAEKDRLVLRTARIESHPWDLPRPPNEEIVMGEPNPTLQALEDAPVVVRVELGVVEMKARAWASLAEGDVVALGRKLGDPAILRVGGVEVARGELVQIDGEYGVRILGRSGATSS